MCDVLGKRLARLILRAMRPPVRRDPVQALPEEVLHLIWRLLELDDLLAASLVSRSWHASLAADTVWRRYSRQDDGKCSPSSGGHSVRTSSTWSWKRKFLTQRSLLHNWYKSKYHTCIKTPVTGTVVATETEVCVWKDTSLIVMTPTNSVVTNHIDMKEAVESVQTCGQRILVTTESRRVLLYGSSGGSAVLDVSLDPHERDAKLSAKFVSRCRKDVILLYDATNSEMSPIEIPLPDCKNVQSYHLLTSGIIARLEPLDFNYETIYSLYSFATGKWSILTKLNPSPLGSRQHLEFCRGDHFLHVNWLLVEDTFMYSNVSLYLKEKPLTREIISNCHRKYFCATFTDDTCLYSVADYRLSALDLNSLKAKEVYVWACFERIDSVLERFFTLTYPDRLEVWDYRCLKRLYSIAVSEKDKVLVRNDFVAVTSWPGTSLPPSLRILNFTEPSLTEESPTTSTFDLTNVFM